MAYFFSFVDLFSDTRLFLVGVTELQVFQASLNIYRKR